MLTPTTVPGDAESCLFPANDAVFKRYHDQEWGVPAASDQALFEKVCLEGFQSGLSWRTILHRRDGFRAAFKQFDMDTIADFTDKDVDRLMNDQRIIRNRRKINSVINNARRARELRAEHGSLAAFFWHFEPPDDSRPSRVTRQWLADNPKSTESTAIAASLKSRGWSFVGPTTMYALMQALGLVNDHVQGCSRRPVIQQLRSDFVRPPGLRASRVHSHS